MHHVNVSVQYLVARLWLAKVQAMLLGRPYAAQLPGRIGAADGVDVLLAGCGEDEPVGVTLGVGLLGL